MTWFRVLAGVLFLAWFGCIVRVGWLATRNFPAPDDWKADKGQLDPHSDEFRRLIMR
jgi:hypothetical protein